MTDREDDSAAARKQFASEEGKIPMVEQALAERANAVAYGGDTSGPDKILRDLGFTAASRRRAAAAAAAAAAGTAEAQAEAPAGRAEPRTRQSRA